MSNRVWHLRLCNKIFVLEKGKISQQGSFEELRQTTGYFSQTYNKQMSILGVENKIKTTSHLKELVQRNDLELEDYLLYGKTFIQLLEDYDESKVIFETIYNNYNLIEQSIKRRGFTATKITENEWQEWQQSLSEIVYLLYLSYKNLEMYDEAKILLTDWIQKNPTDDNAQELLEEILQLESS